MTIGDIIRHKRKELDLTQDELAERTGVTKATVSRWESGEIKKIKAPIAMKLADVLDLDPILFVTGQQIIFPDEYSCPFGKKLYRSNIINVFYELNKSEYIPTCFTTEAIKGTAIGINRKGWCFFIVERAKTVEVRARSLQSDVRAYHLLDVASVYYFINYLSWDLAHRVPFQTFGIQRSV